MVGRLLAGIAKKKVEQAKSLFEEKKDRIDENWPMNFALGRTVKLEATPFYLATGSVLEPPKGDYRVAACGKTVFDKLTTFVFYLEGSEKDEAALEVNVNKNEDVVSIEFQRQFDQIFPETAEDWGAWLDEDTGMIGWKDFTAEDKEYQRTFPEGGDKVAPFEFEEKSTSDPYGEPTVYLNHSLASYARPVGEAWERMIIDQIRDDQGEFIRIIVGMEINKNFVTVL